MWCVAATTPEAGHGVSTAPRHFPLPAELCDAQLNALSRDAREIRAGSRLSIKGASGSQRDACVESCECAVTSATDRHTHARSTPLRRPGFDGFSTLAWGARLLRPDRSRATVARPMCGENEWGSHRTLHEDRMNAFAGKVERCDWNRPVIASGHASARASPQPLRPVPDAIAEQTFKTGMTAAPSRVNANLHTYATARNCSASLTRAFLNRNIR